MKTLKFSKNSWHYKLARFGDEFECRDLSNICSYTRAFLWGTLLFSLFTMFIFGIVVMHGEAIGYIAAMIAQGTFIEPDTFAGVCLMLYCALFTIWFFTRTHIIVTEHKFKEDNFVVNAYHSFKDKYCVRIEVKDEV